MCLTHTVCSYFSFFFNDTATTEIYTLSLHDALPICAGGDDLCAVRAKRRAQDRIAMAGQDRKSTRLNSSHMSISYAVFCLKKKKKKNSNKTSINRITHALSNNYHSIGTRVLLSGLSQ